MRRLSSLLVLSLTFSLGGCLAAAYAVPAVLTGAPVVGDAFRGRQRDMDAVLAPGVTAATLAEKRNLGLNISGVTQSGQYVGLMSLGAGTTNANVFSDMISMEFLKLGYQSRVVADSVSENMPATRRNALVASGLDLILLGNLNLSTTTSMGSGMVGGEWGRTGVTSFTVKGLDPRTGTLLFIISGQYAKAKTAAEVAADLGRTYHEMVQPQTKPE